jgi:hypothetical protein
MGHLLEVPLERITDFKTVNKGDKKWVPILKERWLEGTEVWYSSFPF